MRAFMTALSAPKLGNRDEECEDAYAVHPSVPSDETIEIGPILASVADGASESLLAGSWAAVLTKTVTELARRDMDIFRERSVFAASIVAAIDKWEAWLEDYLLSREARSSPIRWYEKPGLERGAYATLVAASFLDSSGESGTWSAAAIGDSCLFQVRGNRLLQAFPVQKAEDFDSSPHLLNSKNRDAEIIARRVEILSGSFIVGDQFFFGTDALACWFLTHSESGRSPWNLLRDISCRDDPQYFTQWICEERAAGRMKNDDVTLVHVDFG